MMSAYYQEYMVHTRCCNVTAIIGATGWVGCPISPQFLHHAWCHHDIAIAVARLEHIDSLTISLIGRSKTGAGAIFGGVSSPCRFITPSELQCKGEGHGSLNFNHFYASAFRRRRHYVFGLSVRPSVRPKPEIPSFDLYMDLLVHPTNHNRFTACPSVHLSVRPSGEVSGHLPENAWREWPEI